MYANKQLLRIGAVALAALALVFWGQPTGKTVALLAVLLLVALALIEFLAQPPQRTAVAPGTGTPATTLRTGWRLRRHNTSGWRSRGKGLPSSRSQPTSGPSAVRPWTCSGL